MPSVYVYQAALVCEDCGKELRRDLRARGKAPENAADEHSYNSDDFPKGPYPDGGGEADVPYHCDICGEFLENPLTSEGIAYVEDRCQEDVVAGRYDSIAIKVWGNFYDVATCPE